MLHLSVLGVEKTRDRCRDTGLTMYGLYGTLPDALQRHSGGLSSLHAVRPDCDHPRISEVCGAKLAGRLIAGRLEGCGCTAPNRRAAGKVANMMHSFPELLHGAAALAI